jgi:hypothetical protein
MKKILLLLTFMCASAFGAYGQQPARTADPSLPPTWLKIAPANAGFTILFPGKPEESASPVEGRPNVENHVLTFETKAAGYVVSYVEFPEEITDPAQVKQILDNGREGGLAAGKAELVSEKDIKLNDYSGREWSLKMPGGLTAIARAYWVKRALYQTIFITSPTETDSPESIKTRNEAGAKFLNSFALAVK